MSTAKTPELAAVPKVSSTVHRNWVGGLGAEIDDVIYAQPGAPAPLALVNLPYWRITPTRSPEPLPKIASNLNASL